MNVSKISYSQSRESVNSIGLKRWDKVGVEAELHDGDIYEQCFTELKKEVDGFYNSINPPSPYEHINVYSPEIQVEKPIGVTIDDINSCGDKKVLETYKFLIKGKPDLEAAYLKKLKQFMQ